MHYFNKVCSAPTSSAQKRCFDKSRMEKDALMQAFFPLKTAKLETDICQALIKVLPEETFPHQSKKQKACDVYKIVWQCVAISMCESCLVKKQGLCVCVCVCVCSYVCVIERERREISLRVQFPATDSVLNLGFPQRNIFENNFKSWKPAFASFSVQLAFQKSCVNYSEERLRKFGSQRSEEPHTQTDDILVWESLCHPRDDLQELCGKRH